MEVKPPLFNTGRAFSTPHALEALERRDLLCPAQACRRRLG